MYLQGQYEVQVLDSYGLTGEDNECGGIYKVCAPRVNMCAPPGQWQSYDITFQAPRFNPNGTKARDAVLSVVHNGIVIHDGLSIPATGDKSKGIALAYIDARDVMQRLDEVMCMDWQNRYSHAAEKTVCEISLLIEGQWITRSGGAGDSDIEAEKGAVSDAFKRAAVLFGIGQYLYSLPNQWFDLTPAGRSYKLAGTPTLPKWATPKGYDEIMEKRARTVGTPERVAVSVWDSMDESTQRRIQGVADAVRAYLEEGDDMEIVMRVLSEVTDMDERVALESRFTSQERAAIKKYQQLKDGK